MIVFNSNDEVDDIYSLSKATELSIGGIGLLCKQNKYVFKLTFNMLAFIHNINAYYILKAFAIPCSALHSFRSIPIDKYSCIDKYYSSLQKLYNKCPSVYNGKIYILKYEAYEGNAYSLYQNSSMYAPEDLIYFKLWSYATISVLNRLNIYHNDLKMDNILIRKNNKRNDTVKINNIIICNRSSWTYYLNDFDMTLTFSEIECDFNTLRYSMKKLNLLCDTRDANCELSSASVASEAESTASHLSYWLSFEDIRRLVYINLI